MYKVKQLIFGDELTAKEDKYIRIVYNNIDWL